MRVSPRGKCDTCEFFPGRNRYRRVSPREKCDWAAIYKHNFGGVLLTNGFGLSQSDGNCTYLWEANNSLLYFVFSAGGSTVLGRREYCPDCQSVGTHTKGGGKPWGSSGRLHGGLLDRISNALLGWQGREVHARASALITCTSLAKSGWGWLVARTQPTPTLRTLSSPCGALSAC